MVQLDNLPNEIIEAIFLESLNLNLPRASHRLGLVLSSTSTKLKLMLKVFSSDGLRNLRYHDEVAASVSVPEDGKVEHAIARLQSEILACRWCTWTFMKLYMENFITNTILREFPDRGFLWEDGEAVRESVVREYVHSLVQWPVDLETHEGFGNGHGDRNQREARLTQRVEDTKRARYMGSSQISAMIDFELKDGSWHEVRAGTIASSLAARSWFPDDPLTEIVLEVGPGSGLVTIESWQKERNEAGNTWKRAARRKYEGSERDRPRIWRSVFFPKPYDMIPRKLLTGPWTEEKVYFLESLLIAKAFLDNTDLMKLASIGLMDAIEGNNYRVVDLLASGPRSCDIDDTRFEKVVDLNENLDEYHFDGRIFVRYNRFACFNLGVSPTTEHLRTAIQSALSTNYHIGIVKRLIAARHSDFDRDDPSINALIGEGLRASDGGADWIWIQFWLKRSERYYMTSSDFNQTSAEANGAGVRGIGD